ncbi:hypothetical protein D3C75_1215890 [compost metagenome]
MCAKGHHNVPSFLVQISKNNSCYRIGCHIPDFCIMMMVDYCFIHMLKPEQQGGDQVSQDPASSCHEPKSSHTVYQLFYDRANQNDIHSHDNRVVLYHRI